MELLDRGAETELVLLRTVAERARSEHSDKFEAALHTVGQKYFISRYRKQLDEGRINQSNDSWASVRQYQSPLCDPCLHVGAIEVGLTLTDCQGFVGAYDGQGWLRACVNSSNPALQGWAGRLYERYRDRSCLLTADTMGPRARLRDVGRQSPSSR